MSLSDARSAHTFSEAETSAAIERETNRIIASTVAKHNIDRNQLTVGQLEDAKHTATAFVSHDQELRSNPLFGELEQERQRNKLLSTQLEAIKAGRTNLANDNRPAVSVEQVRARVGELAWNHQLGDAGRLQAIGVDPGSVTTEVREQIKTCFGRGADSHRANDLFKSNPGRYRHLKEIGKALNLLGA